MSGSEANDLALSLAQALTGRKALVTRERAYHGGSGLSREMTVQPQWHGGLSAPAEVPACPAARQVRQLPKPNGARIADQADLSPDELTVAAAMPSMERRASSSTTARAGSITPRRTRIRSRPPRPRRARCGSLMRS